MECERNSQKREKGRGRVDEICKEMRGMENAKEEKCPR